MYPPIYEIRDKLGYDDLEDYDKSSKYVIYLVSKEMLKSGKKYNNFYYDQGIIVGRVLRKYNYNAWNVEDAHKAGENIVEGVSLDVDEEGETK